MKRFITICQVEFVLFIRDFFGFFFTLVFPTMMLILFGSIYGNNPIYPGAEVGMIDVSVPAYCVMVIGVTGLMSLPLTLAEYKEKKIYKRFDATPVGKKSIMVAQVCINIVMTFAGFLVLLFVGLVVYQVQIRGDFFSILLAMLISVAAMFSIGFFFTAVARDTKITNLLCYLSYFLMIFLSGATMPDMLFPESVRTIANLLPMTYAVDLIQGIFSGYSLTNYITELIVLLCHSVFRHYWGNAISKKRLGMSFLK